MLQNNKSYYFLPCALLLDNSSQSGKVSASFKKNKGPVVTGPGVVLGLVLGFLFLLFPSLILSSVPVKVFYPCDFS